MNTLLTAEIKGLKKSVYYLPAVSIILPFKPKMTSKSAITLLLNKAADKVERLLIENYPNEFGEIVMNKLKVIYNNLNFCTHRKSIAIYVSPVFEKVIYLDVPVKVEISVDEYFSIRNIVSCKQKNTDYNVMLLGDNACSIYTGDGNFFKRILFNTSDFFKANYKIKKPFTDLKIAFPTFLQYMDLSLKRILSAYPAPLFVVGSKKTIAQFKETSVNSLAVNQYITGSYESLSTGALQQLLQPFVNNWAIVKKQYLLNKMKIAVQTDSLVFGIRDVYEQAIKRNGKLLFVQNNYKYSPEPGSSEEIINNATQPYNNFSYIKDVVDVAIEKVLENGGDVEFVEEEFLKDLGPIALIN